MRHLKKFNESNDVKGWWSWKTKDITNDVHKLEHSRHNDFYMVQEGINLRMFSPLSIFRKAIKALKAAYEGRRRSVGQSRNIKGGENVERQDPRLVKVLQITNALNHAQNKNMWVDLGRVTSEFVEKVKIMKEENAKPYSELKWVLAEEVQRLYSEQKALLNALIESVMLSYYKDYGVEINDDIELVMDFMKTTDIKTIDSMSADLVSDLLDMFQRRIKDSDIHKVMGSWKN